MSTLNVLIFLIVALMLGGCATETPQQQASNDYKALCRVIDTHHGGAITKEEFLAAAKDKKTAANVFLLCDINRNGVLEAQEAQQAKRMMEKRIMKREALRLTEPR